MEHLIADSGLQFIATEAELNPSDQLALGSGRILKYAFVEAQDDYVDEAIFDMLYYHTDEEKYIPIDELRQTDSFEKSPNGHELLDATGMPIMRHGESTSLFSTYSDDDGQIYSINSLSAMRIRKPSDGGLTTAFELLLGKWLPMPMFQRQVDGITSADPFAWCRVRIDCLGPGEKKDCQRYRFTWAFDTQLGLNDPSEERSNIIVFGDDPYDMDNWHYLRPWFDDDDAEQKEFCLCNRADELLDFMSTSDYFSAFSDYIAALLYQQDRKHQRRYIAYYIYLINYLRLAGIAPEVTLHNNRRREVQVDLVLDIGNSRTCGVLFQEGDTTKSMMLQLRDLGTPSQIYEKSFDMRLAFRKADFGGDIALPEPMFQWLSPVRIGDEARRLVYRSIEEAGLSERTTNYSSPKRYLWDQKPFDGQWEFLNTVDDPSNVRLSDNIYIDGLSDLFDHTGAFVGPGANIADPDGRHYSRSSLMTFVMVEILLQANAQINSPCFRDKHDDIDCRRTLRSVIVTCPTAMPVREQARLRQAAEEAVEALAMCMPSLGHPVVTPTSQSLRIKGDDPTKKGRQWSYDEASCCQLVYLYAEIAQRYKGEIATFFDLKGHCRKEDAALANAGEPPRNSLTVGSIDIGAGTTDVMVCTYRYRGDKHAMITPTPVYWESFYLAGDEILRNIIQNTIIEGRDHGEPGQGNIFGALHARLRRMSNDELLLLPCLKDNRVYAEKVGTIVSEPNEARRSQLLKAFATNLLRDFFGHDSAMMAHKNRRCRVDFNTQVSMHIAQSFLEFLRLHRPSKSYTYDELFSQLPPADYLLDYFSEHFGFSFTELSWRFDPEEVGAIVRNTLEPLMQQLSVLLYAHHCDILILAGRPSSLDAVTELFIKYLPTTPDRLIRLNDYRVGSWYPFADGQGYFYDQKSVVAVGAMVGHCASASGFRGKDQEFSLSLDFSEMIMNMKSTANYIGEYNPRRQQVPVASLTPKLSSATLEMADFPAFLGCRQLDAPLYQARPLYAIYNASNRQSLHITLSRDYNESREDLKVEEVMDSQGNTLPKSAVSLVQQSICNDGQYWLDKGEFELAVN